MRHPENMWWFKYWRLSSEICCKLQKINKEGLEKIDYSENLRLSCWRFFGWVPRAWVNSLKVWFVTFSKLAKIRFERKCEWWRNLKGKKRNCLSFFNFLRRWTDNDLRHLSLGLFWFKIETVKMIPRDPNRKEFKMRKVFPDLMN